MTEIRTGDDTGKADSVTPGLLQIPHDTAELADTAHHRRVEVLRFGKSRQRNHTAKAAVGSAGPGHQLRQRAASGDQTQPCPVLCHPGLPLFGTTERTGCGRLDEIDDFHDLVAGFEQAPGIFHPLGEGAFCR